MKIYGDFLFIKTKTTPKRKPRGCPTGQGLPVAKALGDEDIPSYLPSFPSDDVAAQSPTNEVRIGPMTRARAKLLGQQVNSFLSDIHDYENFILPK